MFCEFVLFNRNDLLSGLLLNDGLIGLYINFVVFILVEVYELVVIKVVINIFFFIIICFLLNLGFYCLYLCLLLCLKLIWWFVVFFYLMVFVCVLCMFDKLFYCCKLLKEEYLFVV